MILIWQKREQLQSEGILLIMLSILLTIFGEIAFTQYASIYAPSNRIGHVVRIFSSWLMFQAIVVENLRKPYMDLIKSEQYNRHLFESSPIGLVLSRMNGEIQDINTAGAQILGWTVKEMKGKSIWGLPGDNSLDDTVKYLNQMKPNQVNPPFEKYLLNRNGEKVPVRISSRQIERNGEWYIWSSMEDISERKASEAKVRESNEFFRAAFDNTAVGNLMIDENGTIQLFNTAAEQIFGYQAQEVIGRYIGELLPEVMKSRQGSIQLFLQAQELMEKPPECLMSGTRKHGEKFNLSLAVGVAQRGDRRSLIISVRDLTDFEKMEKQLLQAQKMEAVGQLTGGIAHDFNNLMQVLSVSVDLLNDRKVREIRFEELLDKMARSINRGTALTQHLLAFSRQQALSPASIEVNALIGEIREMLALSIGAEIVLQTDLARNAWNSLVDPGQLEHAILNLAINARDAMPDGGTLTISTQNVTLDAALATRLSEVSPGDYVKISVTDTGTGMSDEVIGMVFDPFFTTKPTGKGTGLGLSMVFGFIKQSGGHVSIESELGKGSSVSLFIPRTLVAPVREHGHAAAKPESGKTGSERILVVEDEELVRGLSVMILGDAGYQVVGTENGPQALAAMRNGQTFDLLFTDMSLTGGMNGKQVAEEARRLQPAIKVLYTSGYAHQEMPGKAKLVAGDMVIEKPYRAAALLTKVRTILDA